MADGNAFSDLIPQGGGDPKEGPSPDNAFSDLIPKKAAAPEESGNRNFSGDAYGAMKDEAGKGFEEIKEAIYGPKIREDDPLDATKRLLEFGGGAVRVLGSPFVGVARGVTTDQLRSDKSSPTRQYLADVIDTGAGMAGGGAAGKVLGLGGEALTGARNVVGKVGERTIPSIAQRTVTEIGPTSDASVLGGKMYGTLKGRVDTLLKDRSGAEKKLRAQYLAEGVPKEGEVISQYRDFLRSELSNPENAHPSKQAVIQDALSKIDQNANLHSLIEEKRRLASEAEGNATGYDAVGKVLSGRLSNNLGDIIKKEIPSYDRYAKTYGAKSADINLFEDTALGKRVTSEASEFLPDQPKFDPAQLPKKFFQSEHSVDLLRKLSGGDEQFVKEAAGEHAASQLKNLSPEQARKWLSNNESWLKTIPFVNRETERYVKNLERAQKAFTAIKWGTGIAGAGALAGGVEKATGLLP